MFSAGKRRKNITFHWIVNNNSYWAFMCKTRVETWRLSLSLSFSLLFTVSRSSPWQQMRHVTWPENSQHLIGSWRTFKLPSVSLNFTRDLYTEREKKKSFTPERTRFMTVKITHTHLKKGVWSDVFVCFRWLWDYLFTDSDLNESVHLYFSLSPGEFFSCFYEFLLAINCHFLSTFLQ